MASKVRLNPASHTPQTGFLVLSYLQADSAAPQNGGASPLFSACNARAKVYMEGARHLLVRAVEVTFPCWLVCHGVPRTPCLLLY